jgi:YidC/Oxa1 family membrane protein insertase
MPLLLATAVAKVAAAAASTSTTTVPAAARATDHSIFSPIARPIADVLAAFYAVIPNYGVAIILLSLAWMAVIAPLTLKSTRSMLAMQKLQPQLKKLQAEHKNDRQAFAAAQMELFKEHNVSPFGSCLPTLLPLPVFFALFRVIDGLSHHVNVNGKVYADPDFLSHGTKMYNAIVAANGHINAFGLDLSKNALSGHSSFLAAVPFYVLLLIMIGTQYLQTAQMMSRNPAANDNPQMKMMKYLPIVFGVVCIRFPAGVILYYAMSNLCRMAQQTLMYRYDPKVKALVAQEVVEVEAMTRDIDHRRAGSKSAKRTDDTPPARSSRFRDALNQATKQAAEGRAGKAAGGAKPSAKPSPAPAARTPPKGRPTGSAPRGAPAKGTGAKPPAAGQPVARPAAARQQPAKLPAGKKPPLSAGRPAARNGAPVAKGGPANRERPVSNGTAAPGRNAADPAAKPAPATAVPAGRAGAAKIPRNGNDAVSGATTSGNGHGPDPSSAPEAGVTGSNGTAVEAATGNGSSGIPKSPPTGAGSGRTGASQPRTPRKRRGR